MTTWCYAELGHDHPLEKTDAEILEETFEWWKGKYDKRHPHHGKPDYVLKEMCIDDWVVVHWAWRKYKLYEYIFRGNVIFSYDPETKECKAVASPENGVHFNFCKYVDDDFVLFERYFKNIREHRIGVLHHSFLKSIEVD